MGRDWYWGGGGKSSKNGGRTAGKDKDKNKDSLGVNPSGCMCSVFQILNFHHFQIPTSNQQHQPTSSIECQGSSLQQEAPTRGNEAPRNSLELDNPPLMKPDECLHIPMGIQVKTNLSQIDSCSSEISSSPSTKTPTLVARLMGLEILPDQCSSPTSTLTTPSLSTKSAARRRSTGGRHEYSASRSLPETPRISSARKSDVEHRFSLQINKENVPVSPNETRFYKRRDLKIIAGDEENRSPGNFARQIVKQAKERRVGSDITNNVKSRSDFAPTQLKSRKITATQMKFDCDYSNSSPGKAKLKLQKRPKMAEERDSQQCYKLKKPPQTSEILRKKKEEKFVRTTTEAKNPDKRCKKSPLSNDAVPTILPIKKDPIPPATKIPQKQVLPNFSQDSKRKSQLSSCSSHSYSKQQETVHLQKTPQLQNGVVSAIAGAQQEEFEYITRILKRTGIDKETPISFAKWFSPSHPIDPSIFHYLEFFTPKKPDFSQLSHRSYRKLIFQLVDEILAEILKPFTKIKPWVNSFNRIELKGGDLIGVLCSKVASFPRADCRFLEDIDRLIEKDFPPVKEQRELAFEEEGEGIVMEVEKELLDTLVHETTLMLYGR